MSEKIKIWMKSWMDTLFKVAVILGSVAMAFANLTFASKEDISKVTNALHGMEIQIQALNLGLVSQTSERGHLSKEINSLKDYVKDVDLRVRSLERK